MNNNIKEPNREFWKSVNEFYHGRAEVGEFPDSVKEEFEVEKLPPMSRRKFVALLGASSAFALASCNNYRDKGEIISYNDKPEYANFGDSVYYASTLNDGSGILIKTREGRPIKIDGNPDHPIFNGKISSQAQANILGLYDPDRIQNPLKKTGSKLILNQGEMLKTDWATADNEITAKLMNAVSSGKEIAIVTHSVLSPTQKKLFDDFTAKFPTVKVYSYELHNDTNKRIAWKECYGTDALPTAKLDEAKIILTFEADILGTEGNVPEQVRQYTSRRNVEDADNFNRLYAVEASLSQTGMNADYRFRLSPEKQMELILILMDELSRRFGESANAQNSKKYSKSNYKQFAIANGIDEIKVKYLIEDLVTNREKALIIAGEKLPVAIHKAVNHLNALLNFHKIFNFSELDLLQLPLNGIVELTNNLRNGKVAVIINLDSNPVYHFNLSQELWNKAETKISMVEMFNESCANNDFVLPINHALESWNDFNLKSGIFSLQQPVIAPLYDTRQKESILLSWISGGYSEDIYHKYLMSRWESEVYPASNSASDFKKFWYSCLHDGVIQLASQENKIPDCPTGFDFSGNPFKENGFTVILNRSYSIGDGRYANNGWLQELPHPVSKVAWDNYAAISPKTANDIGVKNNDIIEINVAGRKVKLPVIEQPGLAEKVIATELGYGRTNAGEVGNNVGFNANVLMTFAGDISHWIYTGAKVTKTGETYKVSSSQEHHPVDEDFVKDFHFKRDFIQEGTVNQYKNDNKFLKHHKHEIDSMTPDVKYKGVKWAMAIDLNKCISCTNCITACNIENNIPVVGKDQFGKGREMQWIRLDRYYSGTPEEPKVSTQPMLCQHCDHAPCENVCPVVATNHSEDGLNQMVYNRCVGTRYCSNNCPYKVRRFNFFNFRDRFADGHQNKDSLSLLHNPEVTVRSRGVMEKCTFCVQRISEARQEAIKEGRPLKGDDVKTACQVACPADAIVFGDMNDEKSEISKLRKHDLGYHVLELLNVRPNVTYIAKLRNLHTEDK